MWCGGGCGDTNNTWRIHWLGVDVVSSMCGVVWCGVGDTGVERELSREQGGGGIRMATEAVTKHNKDQTMFKAQIKK